MTSNVPRPETDRPITGENRQISPKFTRRFGILLLFGMAVSLWAVKLYLNRLERSASQTKATANSVRESQIPPAPRLQSDPPSELAAFRKNEEQRLTRYE